MCDASCGLEGAGNCQNSKNIASPDSGPIAPSMPGTPCQRPGCSPLFRINPRLQIILQLRCKAPTTLAITQWKRSDVWATKPSGHLSGAFQDLPVFGAICNRIPFSARWTGRAA